MKPTRFDTLVRSFYHPASRRGVLGMLAGAAGLGLRAATAAPPESCGEFQKRCGDLGCYDVNFQRCCSCKATKTLGPVGANCKKVVCA